MSYVITANDSNGLPALVLSRFRDDGSDTCRAFVPVTDAFNRDESEPVDFDTQIEAEKVCAAMIVTARLVGVLQAFRGEVQYTPFLTVMPLDHEDLEDFMPKD